LFLYLGAFVPFLTEFSAGVLGIYLGLQVDRAKEQKKKNQDRNDLFNNLNVELKEIEGMLGRNDRLFFDIWDSAISSGQLMLLHSEQVIKLSRVYRLVKICDYEAQTLRRVREEIGSFRRWTDAPIELRERINELGRNQKNLEKNWIQK
jgi:hypothetical protein